MENPVDPVLVRNPAEYPVSNLVNSSSDGNSVDPVLVRSPAEFRDLISVRNLIIYSLPTSVSDGTVASATSTHF